MYSVYILCNRHRTVLYVGVTSDLTLRVRQHRAGLDPKSFATRYQCHLLVYFETTTHIQVAIAREKQLKKWSRTKKAALIESVNPKWRDLAADLDR